jgi:hypothetical protein
MFWQFARPQVLLCTEYVGGYYQHKVHTYIHIHSINPVSAENLQLDIEHVFRLDNTRHTVYVHNHNVNIIYYNTVLYSQF